ncbi:MAG: heavy metal translocating P-type ATPase metal-binding domain-containing protein [Verrucomicrobiota bacterium]|nr:heavy metal translocating P-type ATPase metal-binding domain-containing protein [Verrucomicrobiota bacterium]
MLRSSRRLSSIVTVIEKVIQQPTGKAGREHRLACFHCGADCRQSALSREEKQFCCQGCLTVFELLQENGLEAFYKLDQHAGVRVTRAASPERFAYLDAPSVFPNLVDFSNEKITRVTFRLPTIHCIACVWLLENLFRLQPGVGRSEVDFLRREASIVFETGKVRLSEIVTLLATLGYEPDLTFADCAPEQRDRSPRVPRKLWMQLGVAGFAFGNSMLFSIAVYLGLDAFDGPAVRKLVGYISLLLALPVLLYSAQDYFKMALQGLRHRVLSIEVPIVAGIIVIFAQSAYEVISGSGEGYFDSFSGLLFFLLCGRLFQQKSYERLLFDRDFKAFFPLAVTRKAHGVEASIPLSELAVGDLLLIRNGELVPADSVLVSGDGLLDYSFVTGEATPVQKRTGDLIYAGGRQMGGAIELQTRKPVSQSYLTSLWNQAAFHKGMEESLDTLINRYSQRFTIIIIAIALAAAAYWTVFNPALAVKSLASVLIVACPCALALAVPFTMGNALRLLGRKNVYVKNAQAIESLAKTSSIVFDKTGTLTIPQSTLADFEGEPLSDSERQLVRAMAEHSTHPLAVQLTRTLSRDRAGLPVRAFLELPGWGMEGVVSRREVCIGSWEWLMRHGIAVPDEQRLGNSKVHLGIEGSYRGAFLFTNALRAGIAELFPQLAQYKLSLLSGDNDSSRQLFRKLFGSEGKLEFNQRPATKLESVQSLQRSGEKVLMIGDGLNDAGALKQSDVGIALVEKIGSFSPASDIIMDASMLPRLGAILRFSRGTITIVRLSFFISTIYNIVGITIAARGELSPIVCAVLMPVSSISVVLFASLATRWWGDRAGLEPGRENL